MSRASNNRSSSGTSAKAFGTRAFPAIRAKGMPRRPQGAGEREARPLVQVDADHGEVRTLRVEASDGIAAGSVGARSPHSRRPRGSPPATCPAAPAARRPARPAAPPFRSPSPDSHFRLRWGEDGSGGSVRFALGQSSVTVPNMARTASCMQAVAVHPSSRSGPRTAKAPIMSERGRGQHHHGHDRHRDDAVDPPRSSRAPGSDRPRPG